MRVMNIWYGLVVDAELEEEGRVARVGCYVVAVLEFLIK